MRSLVLLLVVLGACSTTQKKAILDTAFADHGRRQEYFEATLRVLDQNPKYVDEFFAKARRHPKTLDRFVSVTAGSLHDETLATTTAHHLADHPRSIAPVVEALIDAVANAPVARQELMFALRHRAQTIAHYLEEDTATLKVLTKAFVVVTAKDL